MSKPLFDIGDIVYYKLDKEQNPMFVVSIWIQQNLIKYECKNTNSNCSYYLDFELSIEQNILTKIK
jgi:hypothetical protein